MPLFLTILSIFSQFNHFQANNHTNDSTDSEGMFELNLLGLFYSAWPPLRFTHRIQHDCSGFELRLCLLTWADHLTSLSFGFLIYKMV